MKKLILSLVFLLGLFLTETFAQRIIPKVGLTSPWINLTYDKIKVDPKFGFSIGVGYEIPFKNKFHFQPEINLIQKGADFTYRDWTNKLSLYYLEACAPIKFKFGSEAFMFHLLFTPTLSAGIAGRYKVDLNVPGEIHSYSVTFSPYPSTGGIDLKYYGYVDRRFDLGFQLGGGVEIFNKVVIDLRYGQGLIDPYTVKNRGDFDNKPIVNAKNHVIVFSVGIPIKKQTQQP